VLQEYKNLKITIVLSIDILEVCSSLKLFILLWLVGGTYYLGINMTILWVHIYKTCLDTIKSIIIYYIDIIYNIIYQYHNVY